MAKQTYLLDDVLHGRWSRGKSEQDLWRAAERKKTHTVRMRDVKHWVYAPCWSYTTNDNECFYSIYQVLQQPRRPEFAKDMQRIRAADTAYPLIVVDDPFDAHGRILDGNHRFAKLVLQGKRTVTIKRITREEFRQL